MKTKQETIGAKNQRGLAIKKVLDISKIPSECDFLLQGRNKLMYSTWFHFHEDINLICQNYFQNDSSSFIEVEMLDLGGAWARDSIASKTSNKIYKTVFSRQKFSNDILSKNKNINPSIKTNRVNSTVYASKSLKVKEQGTDLVLQGGNSFNCVNALGQHYIIVGESGIIPQDIPEIWTRNKSKIDQFNSPDVNIGKKSQEKYPTFFEERDAIIQQRQLNKQILKSQANSDASLVVIPNSWSFHIDLEMTVLPNGVVLIHSFEETLALLEKHKESISTKWDYDKLVETTKQHAVQCQHLFQEAKRKLEKRHFIVKEVCGFITQDKTQEGIIASGFNGIVGVLKNGEMLYTLPPNESWYADYFTKVLQDCGVSNIHPIQSQPLSLLANQGGFLRCQTQNIPNEAFLSEEENPDLNPTL